MLLVQRDVAQLDLGSCDVLGDRITSTAYLYTAVSQFTTIDGGNPMGITDGSCT